MLAIDISFFAYGYNFAGHSAEITNGPTNGQSIWRLFKQNYDFKKSNWINDPCLQKSIITHGRWIATKNDAHASNPQELGVDFSGFLRRTPQATNRRQEPIQTLPHTDLPPE
jgi:hypothetical protein